MNEDALVETMATALDDGDWLGGPDHAGARRVLAALRADGFELYRPEECALVDIEPDGEPAEAEFFDVAITGGYGFGTFRLVPVSEGTEQ